MEHAALLSELTPTLESLVDRHLSRTKEWFPHELVPWERAGEATGSSTWSADEAPHTRPARPAPPPHAATPLPSLSHLPPLPNNHLPYYFETIDRMFGAGDAWG